MHLDYVHVVYLYRAATRRLDPMTLSLNFCRLVARNLLSVKLQMAHGERWVHHYSGPESDIKDICHQLSQLDGGRIGLVKDEETGIATITIDHPERRNALSGKGLIQSYLLTDFKKVCL